MNIFKNGLKGEHKSTVFASRPKELNEAIQLVFKLEKNSPTTSNKIYISPAIITGGIIQRTLIIVGPTTISEEIMLIKTKTETDITTTRRIAIITKIIVTLGKYISAV